MTRSTFTELPLAPSGTVSWIHIGDPHLTRSGEQNEIDLGKIVDEINAVYANGGVDFVFVPGDIADDGSVVAYGEFRRHLDRLKLPWCAIVGDHDVHEKEFTNFQNHVARDLYSFFSVGPYCFFRSNAFSVSKPDSFVLNQEQLHWLEKELALCERLKQKAILFLHCYPSDLKQGGQELTKLLHRFPVLLVDMGHTHYNEISNDGRLLYTATRSTGQIEEGPVGYSLVTLDGNSVSWHFIELGSPSLVAVTKPTDERLLTALSVREGNPRFVQVHAKTWSASRVIKVEATIEKHQLLLETLDGIFWTAEFEAAKIKSSSASLHIVAEDESGARFESQIQVSLGEAPRRLFAPRDQDNAIGEWRERAFSVRN